MDHDARDTFRFEDHTPELIFLHATEYLLYKFRPDVSATSSILEQTIEAERRKMMQVHGLLHCLYEVLLYADGDDAILYAQAAQLGAELIDDSVARLDSSKIKPMIEAATRARSSDSSMRRDDRVEEPHIPYVY